MNLRELTGYKQHPAYQTAQATFSDKIDRDDDFYGSQDLRAKQLRGWTRFMKENGFEHLGSGAYGGAYEKPGYPWVFKVFTSDPAYLAFFKYVRQNQNNPNLPKTKGNVIKINDDTFAVRIEKLQPIGRELFLDVQYYINLMLREENIDPESYGATELAKAKAAYPGIYEIVVALNSMPFQTDLHQENIMARGNVPVIVDPVADL